MKRTIKSAGGTSFHGTEFQASVEQLEKALGLPDIEQNYGEDKVNFEWLLETEKGDVFTVYDWKEYRSIGRTEKISWHIGGFTLAITSQARKEILKTL